jgi:RNA polymerase sigma-70 factor (ECF subfamily)
MKQEELENYIDTYGRDLYSFCCCVAGSRQEADDLYQDTFLKLFELGERMVIRTNPKSFLMGVALNLYRNGRRKLSVRQRILGGCVPMDEAAESIPFERIRRIW